MFLTTNLTFTLAHFFIISIYSRNKLLITTMTHGRVLFYFLFFAQHFRFESVNLQYPKWCALFKLECNLPARPTHCEPDQLKIDFLSHNKITRTKTYLLNLTRARLDIAVRYLDSRFCGT